MTREEAQDVLQKMKLRYISYEVDDSVEARAFEMAIEALKQPERKKAKWSEKGVSFACTNCDYRVMEPVNCCPNCGAEMEVEQ